MQDVELLEKYRLHSDSVVTPEGCWTNFIGLHTRTDLFPNADYLKGQFVSELPLNGDGMYGPLNEYVSVLTAIDAKGDDRSTFSAIELGAGWGPWVSAAGVVCKRMGFKRIELVGVEAEAAKAERMVEHFGINELLNGPVRPKLLRGAAWHEDGTVYFPKAMPIEDYGGAATVDRREVDWRGQGCDTEAVPALSLRTVCDGLARVDFAHWDVAGLEWSIAERSREILNERIWYLMIGTHSRKIEGDLLGLFFGMGWDLLRHDPCHYVFDKTKPTLEAMTLNDGCMLFRNPRLD